MDWREPIAGAGGGLLAVIIQWILGRSDTSQDRRRQQIHTEALIAVEQSGKFALAGEQKILHERISEDIDEIKTTVHTMDRKLDDILLTGRINVRRNED